MCFDYYDFLGGISAAVLNMAICISCRYLGSVCFIFWPEDSG